MTGGDQPGLRWRKSSYSNNGGACIEVAVWRKSSHSNYQGSCVEVGAVPGGATASRSDDGLMFVLRDSKDPAGPVLAFSPAEWAAFTDSVRDGDFGPSMS
jgi:hypothetical protein